MNKSTRYIKHIILICILALTLTGCTFMPDLNFDNLTPDTTRSSYETSSSQPYNSSQEISYSATASLQTKHYDQDKQKLIDLLKRHEAVIQSEDSQKSSKDTLGQTYIYSNFHVKVPSEKLEGLSQKIKDQFTISSYNLNSQDVGEQKRSTQEQIDALDLEISEIQADIEAKNLPSDQEQDLKQKIRDLQAQKRQLQDNKDSTQDSINYANLHVKLSEVAYYYNEKPSAFYYFKMAFADFLGRAIFVLSFALMALIFVLPFIILAAFTFLTVRKQWYKWLNKMYQTGKFNVPVVKPQFQQYQENPSNSATSTDCSIDINPDRSNNNQ